ncbi:hypothetical protein JD844_018442, partial [Phrynosoma platyrhinos]
NCTTPPRQPYAALRNGELKDSYLVGTVLLYNCIPGYQFIPRSNPSITCLNSSEWSTTPTFCEGSTQRPGGTDPKDDSGNNTVGIVVGAVVGVLALAAVIFVLIKWRPGRKKGKSDSHPSSSDFYRPVPGDCGSLPKLSNAVPYKKVDRERFRRMESVSYECLSGFYNVHGKIDVVICLPDSTWSPIEEFCERVCPSPPRFTFARAKAEDINSYHTAKTRLTYVCRPGYNTIPGINSVTTCLENYTWSALPVFCEGKSCGDPGKPENGEAVILTDHLYLAKVHFICEEGYRLIGLSSIQCVLKGDGVQWQSKPPECQRQTEPTIRPMSKKITISPKTGK